MSKPWYKSRTIWFNALAGGLTAVVTNLDVLRGDLPSWAYLLALLIFNVANIILRSFTTVPVTIRGDHGDS